MPITNQKKWDNYVSKNKDDYGKACVDTAREAMRLLDEEKDFDCHDLICRADKNDDLTGFMAGAVSSIISQCHSRGEEWRKKWNEGYGVSGDKKGVVNPALLTIKEK